MRSSGLKARAPQCSVRPAGRQGSRSACAGLLCATLLLAGCYTYRPLVGEQPAQGEDVRARLSIAAAQHVESLTGHPLRTVEGRVHEAHADTLVLDVGWGALFAGTPFAARRDTLRLAERDILELERREFSRARTGLVAGGLVAAVALIFRSLSGGGEGTPPGNGEPPF